MNRTRKATVVSRLHTAQGGRCCYCRKKLKLSASTLEHLQRRADGGGDRLDNLAVACFKCNTSRGPRSWVEFATLMQTRAA